MYHDGKNSDYFIKEKINKIIKYNYKSIITFHIVYGQAARKIL